MRFLLLASVAVASLISFDVYAQTCQKAPDCATLGYTKTASQCSGRTYVVCPFDTTKYSCDTTTCADLGYTDTIAECPGEYDVCQYDKTKGKCIYEARPGDLKYSLRTSNHNGWLLCNGGSYYKVQFPELYSAISGSYGTKLPNFINYFIKGAATSTASNLKPEIDYGKEEAGLPNITGSRFLGWQDSSVAGVVMNSDDDTSGSALYASRIKNQYYVKGSSTASSTTHLSTLNLDASRSNSIYGKSTTVTPQNYKANVFIYAGKNKIPDYNSDTDKWLYSDGSRSTTYDSSKTAVGYIYSGNVIWGGVSPITGQTSLSNVYTYAESICKNAGGKLMPDVAIQRMFLYYNPATSNSVIAPANTTKYYIGSPQSGYQRPFKITANGELSFTSYSSSDIYFYYCYMTIKY